MLSRRAVWPPALPDAVIVFATAFVVRLIFGRLVSNLEFLGAAGLDSRFYHDWATALAAGSTTDGAFFMGPLYPHALSIVYRLLGTSVAAAMIFQMLLGSGTTCLAYLVGRNLFGRSTGIVTAVLVGGYGYLLFLERHVLAEPLLLFLLNLLTWLILRADPHSRRRWYPLAGLVVGLLSLGRGSYLAAAVLASIVWLIRSRRQDLRRAVTAVALVALGTALVVLPVTWRNTVRSGEFVLVSANGGINYYIGNHDGADGTFVGVPGVEFFQPGTPVDGGSIALAERRAGHPLGSSGASRYWLRAGLAWNREHPAATIGLWGRKLVMALGSYEIPQIENYDWARQGSSLLRIDGVRFGWLVALGLVGMALAWSKVPRSRTVVLLAGAILVSLLPFFITARYRIALAPLLAVFAAHTLLSIWKSLRAGTLRGWLLPTGAVGVVLVLVNLYQPAGIQAGSEQLREYSLGVLAVKEQRLDAALHHFERSRQEYPDHVPTLANLGTLYAFQGRFTEAVPVFEEVLSLEPRNDRVLENYAVCLEQTGRRLEAAQARERLRVIRRTEGKRLDRETR